MKKIYQLFIIITFAFISIACSGGDQDSPENAVVAFFEAVKEGNPEKMVQLHYGLSDTEMQYMKDSFKNIPDEFKAAEMNIMNVSYNEDKTKARVKVIIKEKSSEREENVPLVNIDGKWFVSK